MRNRPVQGVGRIHLRLGRIFPQGVCDWSKPGVEQQGLKDTWLRVE